MIRDPHRQLRLATPRSRLPDNKVLALRKCETKLVRVVTNDRAFSGINVPGPVEPLRDKIYPALRNMTAGRDKLDIVGRRQERQHASASWCEIYGNTFIECPEIF